MDPKSLYYGAIYEVEVWLKYNGAKGTIRRKLDLVAKSHARRDEIIGRDLGSAGSNLEAEGDSIESAKAAAETDGTKVGTIIGTKLKAPLSSSQERLFEADRDYIAHDTIVLDMCTYLRKKGINSPEEYLSLPVR